MHEKLLELSKLEKNWDSYGAEPMTQSALAYADVLLRTLTAIQAVEPWIGPTNVGGIALEWHRNGYDLEIEILPDGTVGEVFNTQYEEKIDA